MVLAALFMASALEPGLIAAMLKGVGVGDGAARIAGAKLSIVVGFFGGGCLLIGLSWLARTGRLRHAMREHMKLLEELAWPLGAHPVVIDEQTLGFSAEHQGLMFQVLVMPFDGAGLRLIARCPPQQVLEAWPLGLGPAQVQEGWQRMAEGSTWEIWAQVFVGEVRVEPALAAALDSAFGAGGVTYVRHDASGIEIDLAFERGLDPRQRLPIAIDAALALARANH